MRHNAIKNISVAYKMFLKSLLRAYIEQFYIILKKESTYRLSDEKGAIRKNKDRAIQP